MWIGVACVSVVGGDRPPFDSLQGSLSIVVFCIQIFVIFQVLPESVKDLLFGWWNWTRKHFVGCLEFGSIMFDVDYLARLKQVNI